MDDEPTKALVDSVFEWLGMRVDPAIHEQLNVFSEFLRNEATAAGGIGPTEAKRLWRRHICDSLTFLAALTGPRSITEASAIVDVGSGVGLPGIPLALALPSVDFTLLDRSARRCLLARRAIRILGVDNVAVVEVDAKAYSQECDAVVSRAAFSPDRFAEMANRLAQGPAVGVVAASHGGSRPSVTGEHSVIEVPAHVLGEPAWLIQVPLSGYSAG